MCLAIFYYKAGFYLAERIFGTYYFVFLNESLSVVVNQISESESESGTLFRSP